MNSFSRTIGTPMATALPPLATANSVFERAEPQHGFLKNLWILWQLAKRIKRIEGGNIVFYGQVTLESEKGFDISSGLGYPMHLNRNHPRY